MRKKDYRYFLEVVAWLIATILVMWLLWYVNTAHSAELPHPIERAILHVVQTGLPQHQIQPHPNHSITRDTAARAELTTGIEQAALEHQVDPFLMVAIAFREGSFRHDATDGKAYSTFGVHPGTAKHVRLTFEPRCTLATVRGSAFCSAGTLTWGRAKCGNMRAALSFYATKGYCRSEKRKVRWLVKDRFGIAEKLRLAITPSTIILQARL